MFDLKFYYQIALICNYNKMCQDYNMIMRTRISFTNKEKNDMELYLDNIGGLFHYYMDVKDLRSYIIPYKNYFKMDIPIYIEKVHI